MRYGSPVNLSLRLPVALYVASLVFTPLWAVENPAATVRALVAFVTDVESSAGAG